MTPDLATPLDMHGSPRARGLAQAALRPDSIAAVRAQIEVRLDGARQLLARPHVQNFLDAQWDFAHRHDAEGMAELAGVADGYGIDTRALFAFLHSGQLGGLPADGCSAWAYVTPGNAPMLVKNRDLRGAALPLQQVFRHRDPAWGGRSVLCVGSLGAPGAYSSGINSDGFALVDTQVVTTDQGIGLLRYFTMTRLLARCSRVADAIEDLHSTPQAGGGTLVLADSTGSIAAVEIGHSTIAVTRATGPFVARTNHFLSPQLAATLAAQPRDPGIDNSHARLSALETWLGSRSGPPSCDSAATVMSSHDGPEGTGLCRHGQQNRPTTVSCSIYACAALTLHFATGNPCQNAWSQYDLRDRAGARDGIRSQSCR